MGNESEKSYNGLIVIQADPLAFQHLSKRFQKIEISTGELKDSINKVKEELIEKKTEILGNKKNPKNIDEQLKSFEEYFPEIKKDLNILFGKYGAKWYLPGLVNILSLSEAVKEIPKEDYDFDGFKENKDIITILSGYWRNAFPDNYGIINIDMEVKERMISVNMFPRNKGIINIHWGEFYGFDRKPYEASFPDNYGIVNINGGKFTGIVFPDNFGIVNINGGIFFGTMFPDNYGIVEINGGDFQKDAFHANNGIIDINGGWFKGKGALSYNNGIVNINGGQFKGKGALSYNNGIVNINGGQFRNENALLRNIGIVEINGGKFEGKGPLFAQTGFAKISEEAEFSHSIADLMIHGFLYVMNDDVKIGNPHNSWMGDDYALLDGLVIAPNGVKNVYNSGAAVFVPEKSKSERVLNKIFNRKNKVIVFEGEVKIDSRICGSSEVLKELGDYVWKTSTDLFKNSKGDWIDRKKEALKFVNELAEKYKGKRQKIYVSKLLEGYEKEKGKSIGEFVYERLKGGEV